MEWHDIGVKNSWVKVSSIIDDPSFRAYLKDNYDKILKDDNNVLALLFHIISQSPDDLSLFIGMGENDIVKKVNKGARESFKYHNLDIESHGILNQIKDYKGVVSFLNTLLRTIKNDDMLVKTTLLLLDIKNTNELKKIFLKNIPKVIEEHEGLEDLVSDNVKLPTKEMTNDILDRFNRGEISKEQMDNMMKEFAKSKNKLKK
jgi:hypothetical protein